MNKHLIAGNVGKDPEIKVTNNGMKIANFTIAVNAYSKDKETGERIDSVDWFNVVAFGKLADLVENYVQKGKKLLIVGKVKTRTYQADDGSTRYFTETIADELEFMSSKNEPSEDQKQGYYQEQKQQQSAVEDPAAVEDPDELPF